MSAGCAIVNSFFEVNLELYPDDISCKQHTTEVLASLSFLFKDPKNGTGLFHLDLVMSTLSSYYLQVHSTVDVHDVHHSLHYCSQGPVGAIALSLAAVSPFLLLFLPLLMLVMLKIECGFTLWANGHLTMDIIESAQ